MNDNESILGCFVSSPSLVYGASELEQKITHEQGSLFRSYIWGGKGISDSLNTMKYENYGKDMQLILFKFYIKPIPYLRSNLEEIENYRKKEKAIGIPIIVTDENFFDKPGERRLMFLKQIILQKIDLLAELVKRKKLDTNMELLKADLNKILDTML